MNSHLPERIFLCGFMGAGKSTIGRKLSTRLEIPFMDLDEKIEKYRGQPIPEIFSELGEEGFRNIERQTLLKVSHEFRGVIALGGGSLQNMHLTAQIKQRGLLIFIEVPLSIIIERISGDKNRPLLMDECGERKSPDRLHKELNSLYSNRLTYYRQADIKLAGHTGQSSDLFVEQLLNKIHNYVAH